MIALSLVFVDKNDDVFQYSPMIEELENYDTVICHGSKYYVYINCNENEIEYTPVEFAELVRNSNSYTGKSIRLIACNTGTKDNGFAQQLANIMGVAVLAPTEAVWVSSYGDIFISDHDVLAQMWYQGKEVIETGRWRKFMPQKGAENDQLD